ncbi:MAG: DUF4242 domain-containing protein [Gammaproteobacteria bacterium]
MPQYIIERDIPGANELSEEELRAMSEKARGVAKDLGPDLQWLHSYVTEDKIYCVYIAQDEQLLWKHSEIAGFPVRRVTQIASVLEGAEKESCA